MNYDNTVTYNEYLSQQEAGAAMGRRAKPWGDGANGNDRDWVTWNCGNDREL